MKWVVECLCWRFPAEALTSLSKRCPTVTSYGPNGSTPSLPQIIINNQPLHQSCLKYLLTTTAEYHYLLIVAFPKKVLFFPILRLVEFCRYSLKSSCSNITICKQQITDLHILVRIIWVWYESIGLVYLFDNTIIIYIYYVGSSIST